MIEETRIRMGLLFPNWLPIAITFNKYSFATPDAFAWKDADMIIAYSICSRIIAAVYTMSLGEAQQERLNMVLAAVETAKDGSSIDPTDVIIGTVRHIARRVKKDKPSVDSFASCCS